MKANKGHRGFTLMEVAVALAILGVGLIVIIELFSGGLRLGRTSGEYTKAVGYARIKMEELSLTLRLEEGIREEPLDRNFRYRLEVKRLDLLPPRETDFQPPMELYWVRIQVIWKSGSQERVTEIESYRAVKADEHGEKS